MILYECLNKSLTEAWDMFDDLLAACVYDLDIMTYLINLDRDEFRSKSMPNHSLWCDDQTVSIPKERPPGFS